MSAELQVPETTARVLERAVDAGLSGAALGMVDRSGARGTLVLGHAQTQGECRPLDAGMWWDLASLTKPLFTARQVLRAAAEGRLDPDDALSRFLPELAWMQDTALRERTLRQLLSHTAGLPAWAPLYTWGDAALIRARLLQEAWPLGPVGPVVYSDLGYLLLGQVLERVYGQPLRDFRLEDGLTFSPEPGRSVATEVCAWRERLLRGETHDENAGALGGAAGHAGLFGTLDGVLNQAQKLLSGGWLSPVAQAAALRPEAPGRTLAFVGMVPGWSGGGLCGPRAYGHTGFTGTGLWVEPDAGLAWTLLTNRVHPSRHGSTDIQALRRAVGNTLLAAQH
ncbi:serine hydrolase domain-containing protein [Deinococcus sp. Leaf326]|uniref:serine hydrolase domain-containing protein n=1 Tax=Deinococcus sp. Leaf326 TaxID=1736338 RepID=UPI0006F42B1D|nr:serine hydrolase domain-containing protein [Deinococcus sp. Leaf326]KQR23004.1 esterase [Deinococcus sp. Leaf326]